jgi:hypothetical protein
MKRIHPKQLVARCSRLICLLLPLSLTLGCSTMSNTGEGMVGGGFIGGLFGAILGAAAGRPLEGAAIGAGIGATAGGVAGAAEDRRERRDTRAVAAAMQRGQDELSAVAEMTSKGVSTEIILNHVRNSGAIFNLTPEQITWLKQNNVSDAVITQMQYQTGEMRVRPYGGYVVQPAPVMVYEPMPPPPPVAAVGVYVR